ncbi:hypothetical protein HS7_18300 [Sulfolobales archaeon HS-7]|nr:hypothetical protein HS7_18300 [Sulfolobales archaeon HS-7]
MSSHAKLQETLQFNKKLLKTFNSFNLIQITVNVSYVRFRKGPFAVKNAKVSSRDR